MLEKVGGKWRVEVSELLEDEGGPHVEYTVSAKKLRPLPNNDSQKPLSERCCGALVAGHHRQAKPRALP